MTPTTSLVLVDLQYDFFDAVRHGDTGRIAKAACLPGVQRIVAHARAHSWRIIHAITCHKDRSTMPYYLQRRGIQSYCMAGTDGVEIVAELKQQGDVIIEKQQYDAFEGTELDNALEDSQSVVIGGLATDCCVLFTAQTAANKHRMDVYLPYQAVSASTVESYMVGLSTAEKSFAAVVDLEKLLQAGEPNDTLATDVAHYQTLEDEMRPWFLSELEFLEHFKRRNTNANLSVAAWLEKYLEEKSPTMKADS